MADLVQSSEHTPSLSLFMVRSQVWFIQPIKLKNYTAGTQTIDALKIINDHLWLLIELHIQCHYYVNIMHK